MKKSPVGAKLFNSDGHTDMTKLTVAFRNFANAPKTFSAHPTHQNVTQTSRRKREPVLRPTPALNGVPLYFIDRHSRCKEEQKLQASKFKRYVAENYGYSENKCVLTLLLHSQKFRHKTTQVINSHCSDDRALDASGSLTGVLTSHALLREMRRKPRKDKKSRNQPTKPPEATNTSCTYSWLQQKSIHT